MNERSAPPVARMTVRAGKAMGTPSMRSVPDRSVDPVPAHRETGDDDLLVDLDADADAAVLQGADELETGAVANVCQSRVGMAAEGALQDAAVAGAVEDGAPLLQLAHAVRCLPRVQLGHARVVEQAAADHGVAKVSRPAVAIVDVRERRGHAAFGHHRVGLAQQRLADHAHRQAGVDGGDRGTQAGAAGADDEDIVGSGLDHRPTGSLR